MEPPNYPTAFRERWYIVALGALIGFALAAILASVLPRTYESTATLFLRVDSPESSLLERSQFALGRVKSYPDLVTSPRVLRSTIDDLDLDITPNELSTRLSAANPRDTVLLTVTASAPTADLASRTANAVAHHLSDVVDDLESDVTLALTLPATAPTSPSAPQPLVLLGLGLLGGLAVGAIVVAAITQLDPRVRSARDVRSLTGLPVVGQLHPALARALRRGVVPSRVDERLRSAVVDLRLLSGAQRPQLIVLVPGGSGAQSRTHDALLGLARTMRASGRSVLVVAGELPAPNGVQALWVRLRDVVESWGRPEDANATAGVVRRSIPERGDAERRTALLKAVAAGIKRHDVVILAADQDADVFALTDLAGAEVILVMNRRRTTRSALVDATTSLEFAGTRPLAVLMTDVGRTARLDLPATWEEGDRVTPPPVEVTLPPAPPTRRRAAHPRRSPAASRSRAAKAAAASDDKDAPAPAAAPENAEAAGDSSRTLTMEPLPGFESSPEPQPEPA